MHSRLWPTAATVTAGAAAGSWGVCTLGRIVTTWAIDLANSSLFLACGGNRALRAGCFRRCCWTDWKRPFARRPEVFVQPQDEDDLRRLVCDASSVPAAGAGHSCNDAPLTDTGGASSTRAALARALAARGGRRKRQADAGLIVHLRTSRGRSPAGHVLRLGVLVATSALLSGCYYLMSDPPPPPETAPLEVVATSSVKPDGTCLLNRHELGAGSHDVVVISELKPSDVRIKDSRGTVVFEAYAEPQIFDEEPRDLPADQVPADPILRLDAGKYTVECEPQGEAVSTASLTVVPARPG